MPPSIKRSYGSVQCAAFADGHAVHLDAKPVKTPGGRLLVVPTRALAEAMAAEWEAQDGMVVPDSMPLTQLSSTALDRVTVERRHITAGLLKYAGTDLLCYRAAHPADLAERQALGWQPILDWAAKALGARLEVTEGLAAIDQPRASLDALRALLDARDAWRLAAIQSAATAMGSLILALALAEGYVTAARAFALSQMEETYQIELWGEDEETRRRRAALAGDIAAAERFLVLLRPN